MQISEISTAQHCATLRRKINRVFGRIPARILNQLSHYTWQRRMLEMAEKTDCELELVNERYTSKTCTRCGGIHHRLGGNKRYVCPHPNCRLRIDRDVNAARNMLLMHLALLRVVLLSRTVEVWRNNAPRTAESGAFEQNCGGMTKLLRVKKRYDKIIERQQLHCLGSLSCPLWDSWA